jgi:hypothetical protein
MTAQSASTVLNGAGAVAESKPEGKLCVAFKAAVEKFCKSPKGRRFNDYFFKELKDVKKYGDIAKGITREVPMLMSAGKVVAGGVSAAATPECADLMKAIQGAASPMTGATNLAFGVADAARGKMLGTFFANGGRGSGCYMKFPDGMLEDGTVIEIKGPGDKFQPGQEKSYKKIAGKNPVVVVSCEQCKAPCDSGGGKAVGCRK